MADTLYDEIQREIAKYPDRRSAILPALRHAQEHYGWLSPEAIEADKGIREYFINLLQDRRTNPRNDVVSTIVQAEIAPCRSRARTRTPYQCRCRRLRRSRWMRSRRGTCRDRYRAAQK